VSHRVILVTPYCLSIFPFCTIVVLPDVHEKHAQLVAGKSKFGTSPLSITRSSRRVVFEILFVASGILF
jgi:hypothetical protein